MHEHSGASPGTLDVLVVAGCAAALILYLGAAARARRRGRPWPAHRSALWAAGLAAAGAGFLGPLAEQARTDFQAHMTAHLIVGMGAPILLVLSRPVTLALRSLDAGRARRCAGLLRSMPVRLLSHPVAAGLLNTGSLWLLYVTPTGAGLMAGGMGHTAVQVHFLLAGYLFTAAVIGRDPNPHRAGFALRAAVLMLAMAAHSILAKYLYVHPPTGVPRGQAETGGYLMYYGGTLADLVLITAFYAQWYRSAQPAADRPRAVR